MLLPSPPPRELACRLASSYVFRSSMSSRNSAASSSLSKTQVSPLVTLIPAPSSTLSEPNFPTLAPGFQSFLAATDAASVKVIITCWSLSSTLPSLFTSVLAWKVCCWKPYSSPHSMNSNLPLAPALSLIEEIWQSGGS